ncbi:MAG TPA: DNA primase [Bryobacteraceae bacterium]|nr:DNA primase [Bryobacteraceae bacterium]
MDFKDQLKSSVDLVNVAGEYVRLKKSGAQRYMGLCPFHNEKKPSFTVHASYQFYKCFSCGEGGDVFTFIQKIEGISFYEAMKLLAERHGIPMPKRTLVADEDSKLRETVFRMHELALEHFRANLRGPAGDEARAYLARRGLSAATLDRFDLGYSERSGRVFPRLFEQHGFTAAQMERSGLVRKRDDGSFYDYFRNRLMFPIHNESGKVIGFGGRALAADDNPKYLNSPETPIYEKSRVLYNFHRAKEAMRKEGRAILVEGYMDAIGVSAAGFGPVVASCGTSLTELQVKALKRHTDNIVVNFDPDAPGAAAAERSLNVLLQEGMSVRIMSLDGGLDPDEYCKQRGPDAYGERLEHASAYYHWMADRARSKHDVRTTEGVVAVLKSLMPVVERISDRVERMAVANDLASYIGVTPGVVLDSFRRAAADRAESRIAQPKTNVRADEKGLLRVLLSPEPGLEELLAGLGRVEILDRIPTARIYRAILAAGASGAAITFDSIGARLEPADQNLLAEVVLSEDADAQENTLDYGRQCLESLMRSGESDRRTQWKARIKEAERRGDLAEALRLARELQDIERACEASR